MKFQFILILIISMVFSGLMAAELPSHPLTFQNWKRVQIHDSTNEVVSLSNEIKGLTTAQQAAMTSSEAEQKKIQEQLDKKIIEQKAKLENLQYSKQLNFEDYFDVYLSKFAGNQKALDYIAKRLSKKSVAYLLQRSISKGNKSQDLVKSDENAEKPAQN